MNTVNPCDALDEQQAAGSVSLVGQQVYLRDGRIAHVLAETPRGYVVEPGFESDDPDIEPWFGGIELAPEVLTCEPVGRYGERVKELETQAHELSEKVSKLQTEARQLEDAHKTRLKFLAQFAGLEEIEQFLRGEITHYVMESSLSVELLAVEDARSNSESRSVWDGRRYHKPLRMLMLFGDPRRREVEWRLSPYSDSSGYGEVCLPFTSEEAARAKAAELLNAKVAELMAKEGYIHGGNYLIESAKKLSLPLPDAFVQRWKASEAAGLAQSIAAKEKELADLKAKQAPA